MKEPNKIIHAGFRATLYGITNRSHSLGYRIPILTFGVSDGEYLLSIGRCVRVAMTLWKSKALRGFGDRQGIDRDRVIYSLLDYWRTIAPTIGRRNVRRWRVWKFILLLVEPVKIIPWIGDNKRDVALRPWRTHLND